MKQTERQRERNPEGAVAFGPLNSGAKDLEAFGPGTQPA
jgi:hypothetical protein